MIKHLVLLKFRSDVTGATIAGCFQALAALRGKVPGLVDFAGGPYSSPEGLQRGYTHGFVMTFESAASRDAYLPHPAHQAVAELIVGNLEGGLDGVVAFDFEA